MIKVFDFGKNFRFIQCPDCKALLQYEVEDIVRDEDGYNDYLPCPVCDEAIFDVREARQPINFIGEEEKWNYFCERCWAPKLQLESGRNDYGPYICNSCSRNPKCKNHYIDFLVTCKFNYDCIHDPGYILAYHPEQYKKRWGDRHYREVAKEACKDCTEEYCNYDYEEK